MATRRSKKTTEFESLPIQVPLSIDTFAAIVDAGRVMEDSIKYILMILSCVSGNNLHLSHSILEQGQMGLKDIEIARDPKRQSEKSTSRALVPLPFSWQLLSASVCLPTTLPPASLRCRRKRRRPL